MFQLLVCTILKLVHLRSIKFSIHHTCLWNTAKFVKTLYGEPIAYKSAIFPSKDQELRVFRRNCIGERCKLDTPGSIFSSHQVMLKSPTTTPWTRKMVKCMGEEEMLKVRIDWHICSTWIFPMPLIYVHNQLPSWPCGSVRALHW